ncbi:phosphotransferase enzyme family protein [Nocardia caishijiensis]|uniref:Ser/Thr protein kinase RdoA (MazF antagonist) n=1 Tax=Nocardia caishijiensis TaxID=184756 RepID=A0ABQ6YJJ6_9NOCA|nr:phosphotransferase [Nocardia caishijiensis]KAF0845972.1 Ser/Thr protein kinase RdoA (MazF antagonist) [Nocardia caishijiensis]
MDEERVFGMGDEPLAAPTWPALTEAEASSAVAATWGLDGTTIEWRSARPLSATVGVRTGSERFVVKRLPSALRDPVALAEEHRFMAHLRARGIPVPEVRTVTGSASQSAASCDRLGQHRFDVVPVSAGDGHADHRHAFVYEVHQAGEGDDRYRADFSWTPFRDVEDAAGAGTMLARLHSAAECFDAPARPARPLLASMHNDVVSAFEWHTARRPALAAFLADRDWRTEVPDLRADPTTVEPLWTHGDWHPTNLLWRDHEVTSVIDFGLSDRTTAVFDLATTVERTAVDWISLRDRGPANVRTDQITALFEGYQSIRPLNHAESRLLPDLLPLAHLGYELSEIDYFLTIPQEPRNAEIAYHDWLLGHLRWYETPEGHDLRTLLHELCVC